MIDLRTEQLRSLTDAPADVPGKRPHISTLMRWVLRGVKGIKLETVVVGGRRYTSVEAINRFVARLSEPGSVQPPAPSEKRQHQIDQVRKRLDAERIK
jgi:hypothetical protein